MGLEVSVEVGPGELDDVLGVDLVEVGLELGHVFLEGDEADGGEVVLSQSEELHDTGVVLDVGIDVDEEHLSFEFLGGVLELRLELLEFGGLLGDEEKIVALDLSSEDDRSGFLGEFGDEGQAVSLDPGLDGIGGELLVELNTSVIELLEEDDSFLLELELLLGGILRGDSEGNVIDSGGDLEEGLSVGGSLVLKILTFDTVQLHIIAYFATATVSTEGS